MAQNREVGIISAVIPLYREAERLEANLASIDDVLATLATPYELVLVDDGSPDGTWEAIERFARSRPDRVRGIRLSRNFGKEAALCAGLERASGNAVLVMDGDLQHPPSLIPDMVSVWRRGEVDIVEAVKTERGKEHPVSWAASRMFYLLFARASGVDLRGASDFKLLSRRAVNAWLRLPERNVFFRGMSAWVGFPRAQMPFRAAERSGGSSGWSFAKLTRLAIGAITSFSSAPLQLVTWIGLGFGFFAAALAARTLYLWFCDRAVSGFSTVILVELIIGCLLMFGLGIIGEYVARIYDEVKARPRYVVERELPSSTVRAG